MLFKLLSSSIGLSGIYTNQSLSLFKTVIVFTLFFSSYNTFSQNYDCKEDLIPMKGDNRMYGYVNLFGEWKVIPFYDRVYPFKGNTARVLKGKKYGLLDCDGKVVLRPEYDEILPFTNGYAWVKKEEKYGLIDYTGKLILQPEYEEVEDVSRFSDFAWVKKGNVWGVFSKPQKKFVHNPVYVSYKMLRTDFALVKSGNGLLGVINYNQPKPVIEPIYESATKIISNALAVVKGNRFGLINDEGQQLTEVIFDSIKRVHQYRLVFSQNGKQFLADEKGSRLSRKEYTEIDAYNGGAFRVKQDDKYGYLTYFGREAITPQYSLAADFIDAKAIVSEKDSVYVINPKNEKLTKGCEAIKRPNKNYFLIKENGRWGVMNVDLKMMLSPQFVTVFSEDKGGLIRAKSEAGFYYIDLNTFTLLNKIPYETASPFEQQTAIVKTSKGVGIIDSLNQMRIPFQYKSIQRLPHYRFALETNDGFVISDSRGKTISAQNYIEIINEEEFPLVVKSKKGYGLVDEKGIEVVESKYNLMRSIGGNYFSIQKGKKLGVVDATGKEILPIDFEAITAYSERFFVVKQNGRWGYVDVRNVVMIPFQFEAAFPFENDKAKVTDKGKCVVIDKKGQVLTSCE